MRHVFFFVGDDVDLNYLACLIEVKREEKVALNYQFSHINKLTCASLSGNHSHVACHVLSIDKIQCSTTKIRHKNIFEKRNICIDLVELTVSQ